MKNKIAFIAHLSELSGAGTSLVETAKAMRGKFDTLLVLPGDGDLVSRANDAGIHPTIIPNPEVAIVGIGLRRTIVLLKKRTSYVIALRRLFREQHIDLVCVNTSASIFAGLAARLEGIPLVWRIHESLVTKDIGLLFKTFLIRRWSTALIYDSQTGKNNLPHPNGKPGLLARNYISINQFAKSGRTRLEAPSSVAIPTRIFMNGTISRKGADLLLEAAKVLVRQDPKLQIKLCIAGALSAEPAFSSRLITLADSPELAGIVRFPGLQQTLASLLSDADLFISPSRNEALPIAMVEAIAAGIPVIATDVGDCADFLEKGLCGWIVPPDNIEALALALHEALKRPELGRKKAIAAYEKVLRVYGSEEFWKPMEDFLSAVISGTAV